MSISRILSTPVDDIAEIATLLPDDVEEVINGLGAILSKCLYCIRRRLPDALEVMLSILVQAASHQTDRVAAGMLAQSEEGCSLDVFLEVCAQLLHSVNAPLRLMFDVEVFFELLQRMCSAADLKDKMGAVLGKLLLGFMHDVAQHADDFRVHRNCASAMITLLRGSKRNKNVFAAECDGISACLEQSGDFFFQMQCVEILFRLYTHNRASLAQAGMREYLRRGVAGLPNDATLLVSIQALLDNYNAEFHPDTRMAFTVVRMEVDGAEVCTHTTMYFSPLLLVVILPGGAGENITIPFEHIRSVKLTKDRKVGLRLNTIPERLTAVMQPAVEGKDSLHVIFTQSSLEQMRSCDVHQWISSRKRHAPRRALRVLARAPPHSASASAGGVVAGPPSHGGVYGSSSRVSPRGTEEERERMADLHHAASVKAARYREEALVELQQASDEVREVLADTRRQNAQDRDNCEAALREDMVVIRRAEASLKESAAEYVQLLNAELEDVQTLGKLLTTEIDQLRERIAKAVGKSEGVEEACLVQLKGTVDAKMQAMEQTLSQITVDGNPLHSVAEHLSRHIDTPRSTTAQSNASKARRLDYV